MAANAVFGRRHPNKSLILGMYTEVHIRASCAPVPGRISPDLVRIDTVMVATIWPLFLQLHPKRPQGHTSGAVTGRSGCKSVTFRSRWHQAPIQQTPVLRRCNGIKYATAALATMWLLVLQLTRRGATLLRPTSGEMRPPTGTC